ncbi:S41 family peptidase [Dyadobacter psychrotolerans]|uniref:PDZ domain-containing protein n=1 Tax=Dyadobacter psychrotolerans TaxID=2541721 RepID=A0A4R5DK88_9BACT|nr:S41 family peptidase [Dyadobacter psychrotolerans]TDE14572.1 PDZ domain-containing protein [Dyadobacter psychrotolerans]
MLHFKKINLLIVFSILTVFLSCKDKQVDPVDETDSASSATYPAVNTWLYEMMKDAYFWYSQMPAEGTLDTKTDPNDYFEKLIYQRSSVDRFSMVTEDIDALENSFNGISKIFGISYSLSYTDDAKSNLGLFLNLVVKGSPAETAGLKRGDIILKVNGTQLTKDNYSGLLSSSESATFTLGTLSGTTITATTTNISVTKAVVNEDPVAFSTVIDKSASGKKIGYLVYTQFVPGTDADANKYDNELRQVFANFKTAGINELVLDLRFNSGGYISSAKTLASLIGKNISASKVFYKEQWNDKYMAYWQKTKGANALNYNFLSEANNVGSNLSRIFVLTSQGTASASELVINGLKPYMEVITIGDHTAGKNLFGSLIRDDQDRWKWGIYMMLGQTANVNGESDYGTVNGMTPTFKIDDTNIPYKAFGNENETLFRKALDVMGVPAGTNGRTEAVKSVTSLSAESFRDNLQQQDKRMIKTDALPLINN